MKTQTDGTLILQTSTDVAYLVNHYTQSERDAMRAVVLGGDIDMTGYVMELDDHGDIVGCRYDPASYMGSPISFVPPGEWRDAHGRKVTLA